MGRKRLQPAMDLSSLSVHLMDAERRAARLERELWQLQAIERLQQMHSGAVDFLYDTVTDTMRFRLPGADERKEIEAFRSFLQEWNSPSDETVEKLLDVFSVNGMPSGKIEGVVRLWKTEPYPCRFVYERIEDQEGVCIVGFANDISDETAVRELLTRDVNRDTLTGLYTEETLLTLGQFEVAALAPGEKAVMCCFDMDHFSDLNSEHGRHAGDGCLRAVAAALKTEFRGVDILARIGPDEFAVFFRGFLAIDVIERRVQHLLDTVHHVQTEFANMMSCSMGVAVTGSPREGCATLLAHAKKALAEVKRYGGNRYRMFDKDRY